MHLKHFLAVTEWCLQLNEKNTLAQRKSEYDLKQRKKKERYTARDGDTRVFRTGHLQFLNYIYIKNASTNIDFAF